MANWRELSLRTRKWLCLGAGALVVTCVWIALNETIADPLRIIAGVITPVALVFELVVAIASYDELTGRTPKR